MSATCRRQPDGAYTVECLRMDALAVARSAGFSRSELDALAARMATRSGLLDVIRLARLEDRADMLARATRARAHLFEEAPSGT